MNDSRSGGRGKVFGEDKQKRQREKLQVKNGEELMKASPCLFRWGEVEKCKYEPRPPPSAVSVLDVRPTRGASSSLFLPLFPGNVMLSAHICLSAEERGGRGLGGGAVAWGQPPSFSCRCWHSSSFLTLFHFNPFSCSSVLRLCCSLVSELW